MSDGAALITLPQVLVGATSPLGAVGPDGTAAVTLPLLSTDGADYGAVLPLVSLAATGIDGTGTSPYQLPITLPLLTETAMGLVGEVGSGSATLPKLGVTAASDGWVGAVTLPSLTLAAAGKGENPGTADIALPQMQVVAASLPSGDGAVTLPLLSVQGTLAVGNNGTLATTLRQFALTAQGLTGQVGTAAVTLPLFTETASGYGPQVGTATVTLPMLVVEATGGDVVINGTTAWSLNVRNNALTQYTNYPFNSFAQFNGAILAASSAGIYLLTGAQDGTTNIDAHVLSGMNDLGTGMGKRVVAAYVRQKVTGDMTLSVITEDNNGTDYLVKYNRATKMAVNKVPTSKGVASVYWQVKYGNLNGSDFTLDTVEILPVKLARRTG